MPKILWLAIITLLIGCHAPSGTGGAASTSSCETPAPAASVHIFRGTVGPSLPVAAPAAASAGTIVSQSANPSDSALNVHVAGGTSTINAPDGGLAVVDTATENGVVALFDGGGTLHNDLALLMDGGGPVGVTARTLLAGEDLAANVLKVEQRFRYFNQAGTTAGVTIESGAGFLHALTINTPVASSMITLYDNTAASGTKIGTITLPASLVNQGPMTAVYDVSFTTGLELVVATGAADVTVAYRDHELSPEALAMLGEWWRAANDTIQLAIGWR